MSTRQQIKAIAAFLILWALWIGGRYVYNRSNPMDATVGTIPCEYESQVRTLLLRHGIVSEGAESTGQCIVQVNHTRLHEAISLIEADGLPSGYKLRVSPEPLAYSNAGQSGR